MGKTNTHFLGLLPYSHTHTHPHFSLGKKTFPSLFSISRFSSSHLYLPIYYHPIYPYYILLSTPPHSPPLHLPLAPPTHPPSTLPPPFVNTLTLLPLLSLSCHHRSFPLLLFILLSLPTSTSWGWHSWIASSVPGQVRGIRW